MPPLQGGRAERTQLSWHRDGFVACGQYVILFDQSVFAVCSDGQRIPRLAWAADGADLVRLGIGRSIQHRQWNIPTGNKHELMLARGVVRVGDSLVKRGRPRGRQTISNFGFIGSNSGAEDPVPLRLCHESPVYRLLGDVSVQVRLALPVHVQNLHGLDGVGHLNRTSR